MGGAGNFQDMVVYLSTDNTQSALQSHVTAKPKSGHVDGGGTLYCLLFVLHVSVSN